MPHERLWDSHGSLQRFIPWGYHIWVGSDRWVGVRWRIAKTQWCKGHETFKELIRVGKSRVSELSLLLTMAELWNLSWEEPDGSCKHMKMGVEETNKICILKSCHSGGEEQRRGGWWVQGDKLGSYFCVQSFHKSSPKCCEVALLITVLNMRSPHFTGNKPPPPDPRTGKKQLEDPSCWSERERDLGSNPALEHSLSGLIPPLHVSGQACVGKLGSSQQKGI